MLSAVPLERAVERIAAHMNASTGSIVVLDRQPGRTISAQYHAFLRGTGRGILVSDPAGDDETLSAVGRLTGIPSSSLGFDLQNATMLLSFGAPMFDGWGNPGTMNALHSARTFTVTQIDPRYSRTARQSDQWIAIAPGTERLAALSLASILLEERTIRERMRTSIKDHEQFTALTRDFTPEMTAGTTGITPETLRTLAQQLTRAAAPIVLCGADPGGGPMDAETEKVIAVLNILLGSVGRRGGIMVREYLPGMESVEHTRLQEIPDGSVGTLFIDGADSGYAIPWILIRKKLSTDASLVVSFSSVLDPLTAEADILIPAPAPFEVLRDVHVTSHSAVPSFALSVPILPLNENAVETQTVLRMLAEKTGNGTEIPENEASLKAAVQRIHDSKRGSVQSPADGAVTPVKEFSSSDDLWNALASGGLWTGEEKKQNRLHPVTVAAVRPDKQQQHDGLVMIASGYHGALHAAQLSPVMSKMFQETDLRPVNNTILLSPVTAQQVGIQHDGQAVITTTAGTQQVRTKISPAVRPGVLEASIGPSPNGTETPGHPSAPSLLRLFPVSADGYWRTTTVTLQKV
ncbi:MAG: molybdopterin-dependent oxidoreductase [Bacteroidetes bacterium]|nr:molybdopterin-dependent oxidoreductase [Bacteroidota bacterium]